MVRNGSSIINIKDLLAPFATVISAAIAIAGIMISLDTSRKDQYDKGIFEAYDNYWNNAMNDPSFALGIVDIPNSPSEDNSNIKFRKYELSVARMLRVCERVLDIASNQDGWQKTIAKQIHFHKNYLLSPFFRYDDFSQYSPNIRALICNEVGPNQCKRLYNL